MKAKKLRYFTASVQVMDIVVVCRCCFYLRRIQELILNYRQFYREVSFPDEGGTPPYEDLRITQWLLSAWNSVVLFILSLGEMVEV